ncbi:uncharacterized protein LOC144859289 [Branchiostoma floridae x Branchiostoma japonicum]
MTTGIIRLGAVVILVLLPEVEGCDCPWGSWGSWTGCSVDCDTCGPLSFRHYPQTDCDNFDIAGYPGERVSLEFCMNACCRDPTCLSFQYNTFRDCFTKRNVCSVKPYVAHGNMYDRRGVPETQHRTRSRNACCSPSQETQTGTCRTHSCCSCSWRSWGPWSSCSRTCGGGTKTRRRDRDVCCSPSSDSETATCNTQPCCSCEWGNWHAWSSCSSACGEGRQTRTRYRDHCCQPSHQEDARACHNHCDGHSHGHGGSTTSFWNTERLVLVILGALIGLVIACG